MTPDSTAGRVFTVSSYDFTNGGTSISFSSVITFNSAGGSAVPNQVVQDGDLVTEPADPTNGGLPFYGWYDVSNNLYDFSRPADRPLTLHAGWPALAVSINPITTLNAGDTVPLTAHIYNTGDLAFVGDVTAASGITSDFANDDTVDPTAVTVEFDPATGKALTLHTFTVHCIIPGLDLTASAGILVAPVAASATTELTASSTTPNQGDAISMTFKVNGVDVTSYATFTSDVATDVIAGNGVTFPHASPHTITATYGAVSTQLLIQVTPTAVVVDPHVDDDPGPGTTAADGGELAGTGFSDSATALWAVALLVFGTAILTGTRGSSPSRLNPIDNHERVVARRLPRRLVARRTLASCRSTSPASCSDPTPPRASTRSRQTSSGASTKCNSVRARRSAREFAKLFPLRSRPRPKLGNDRLSRLEQRGDSSLHRRLQCESCLVVDEAQPRGDALRHPSPREWPL